MATRRRYPNRVYSSNDVAIWRKRRTGIYLYRTQAEEAELLDGRRGRVVGSARLQFQKRLFYRLYSFVAHGNVAAGTGRLDVVAPKTGHRRERATIVTTIRGLDAQLFAQHEHCRQRYLHPTGYENLCRPDRPVPETVDDVQTRIPYRARGFTHKSPMHDGQRKLLLSEIQFLTLHYQAGATVLYVGAAPGTHLPLLTRLFPGLVWHLIDPRDFNGSTRHAEGVTVTQDFFGDELARQWAPTGQHGQHAEVLLFISDIRSTDAEDDDEGYDHTELRRMDTEVRSDMANQQRWVEIVKPNAALLKFRLPYVDPQHGLPDGASQYLAGANLLPIWGAATTTESRLEVIPEQLAKETLLVNPLRTTFSYAKRSYSWLEHEQRMAFFNAVVRSTPFDGPACDGYDACYDCTAERRALDQYRKSWQITNLAGPTDAKAVFQAVEQGASYRLFTQRVLYARQGERLAHLQYRGSDRRRVSRRPWQPIPP